jgi:hypothetical protein
MAKSPLCQKKANTGASHLEVDDTGIRDRAQPFLHWAGSKRKQLPILATFWNADYERYVEPLICHRTATGGIAFNIKYSS